MRIRSLFLLLCAATVVSVTACPARLMAVELSWNSVTNLFNGTNVDVPSPQSCDTCSRENCVERVPVNECVTGKKEVFKTTIRYEYVAIPETRYRWKKRFICKEIPCDFCKPVCKDTEVEHCYEVEHWSTDDHGCGKLHCKTCLPKTEKRICKECSHEPGKTTVKVHYWTCVKEPYVVYRQVRKPVCVKQPRYEKTRVNITRYECHTCKQPKGTGCNECCAETGAGEFAGFDVP